MIGQVTVVDDMHQRKALMAKHADGFIGMPGGEHRQGGVASNKQKTPDPCKPHRQHHGCPTPSTFRWATWVAEVDELKSKLPDCTKSLIRSSLA